jgi:PBSX family phage terminase large subunit
MQSTTLHPSQAQIASDLHRFRVVNCGRRFGKTLLSVWEMFGYAVSKPEARVAYVAPTYQSARDIAWNELKRITLPVQIVVNESRLEVKVRNKFGGESLIVLRGWESIETLRGQAFDFIVLDEVAHYRNFWEHWQEVIRPTLTDRKGHALFISTPKGFNHFYDLFNMQAKDTDYKSFHFSTYDNPHIPKEEVDKAKQELTEDRFAQEYLADFRKTEGLVYKEFSRDRHLFSEEPKRYITKTIGGVDFGTTNPATAIEVKKDEEGRYYVYERLYKRGMTDSAVADYVSALGWNETYPDPESASGVQELRQRGVNVRDVIKNKDSVRNGINVVRELFKANRLFVHESSRNLIWELEMYSYPEKKPDHNEEENPIKENDHALDALRYALMMESGIGKGQEVQIYIPNDVW